MLFGLGICISAVAQTPVVPRTAFYIGAGGNYNSTDFGTQDVNAIGTSQVFESRMLVSTGRAAGPGIVKMPIESNFAPSVQAGYFRQITNGPWLWGAKFSYTYLNSTSSVDNVVVPQSGSFTELATHTTVPFTGAAIARSYQTQLDHQLELMPSSGTSWGKVLCTWASAHGLENTNKYQKARRLRRPPGTNYRCLGCTPGFLWLGMGGWGCGYARLNVLPQRFMVSGYCVHILYDEGSDVQLFQHPH